MVGEKEEKIFSVKMNEPEKKKRVGEKRERKNIFGEDE
jgi:hypothetical protein